MSDHDGDDLIGHADSDQIDHSNLSGDESHDDATEADDNVDDEADDAELDDEDDADEDDADEDEADEADDAELDVAELDDADEDEADDAELDDADEDDADEDDADDRQVDASADADEDPVVAFTDLGLRPELLRVLGDLGYEEPTPIQREAIPLLLEGHDLLGQAATGTGKTAAFALPVLQRINRDIPADKPTALVLVPTRELAMQVSEAMYRYGHDLGARVVPVYGGQPIGRQLQALDRGVHIVVATPGRAIDHINRGSLALDAIEVVVLDEADEMLDMGFADDIEEILSRTPDARQTVLFSATMPPRINRIVNQHLRTPKRVQIGLSSDERDTPLVKQTAYIVARNHKAAALGRILDVESPDAAIVFCRTRHEVDQLTETLNGRGYRAEALHGGMNQEGRDRVMSRMRSNTAELLIATDVAARGLDLDSLTHVVNYDVPSAPEAYVHRIGRVGRAGREGVAITLAEPKEQRLLGNIERITKQRISIEKVPTVAQLRARQLELMVESIRESLEDHDDNEQFNSVIDELTDEFDVRDIALAAIRLVNEAAGNVGDEKEIPDAGMRANKDRTGNDRGERQGGERHTGPVAQIHISLGRFAGVRAGDLVGLIANESGLSGGQIGPIRVNDRFSIVGVPSANVDAVIEAVNNTTLKGKGVSARHFTDDGAPRREGGWREREERAPRNDRFGGGDSRSERPARPQWNNDGPPRRDDDRPARPQWNNDGPPRRDDDRPARPQWNNDRPPRRDDDRPARPQWNNDRERPAGQGGWNDRDRAPREGGWQPRGDRDSGPRQYDRPQRPGGYNAGGGFRDRPGNAGGRSQSGGWQPPRDNRDNRGGGGGGGGGGGAPAKRWSAEGTGGASGGAPRSEGSDWFPRPKGPKKVWRPGSGSGGQGPRPGGNPYGNDRGPRR